MRVSVTVSLVLKTDVPDGTDLRACDVEVPVVELVDGKSGKSLSVVRHPALEEAEVEEA